jgi:hypothetical protein
MGWAENQIKRDQAKEESSAVDNELRLREERMKDEVGRDCFEKVKAYVKTEIDTYNKAMPNSSTQGLSFIPDTSVEEERDFMSKIPSFTIRKKDGRCAYVYVRYRQNGHVLEWRCGASQGSYELRVHPDGAGYFVERDGTPKTPEMVGNELLNMAINAEPSGGGGMVWK